MKHLKEEYEKNVFDLQTLNQTIQSVRTKIERQIEVYRLKRLRERRIAAQKAGKRSKRANEPVEMSQHLIEMRRGIDHLSTNYRQLLNRYDQLQNRQNRIREQLIENDAQVGDEGFEQMSRDIVILRNYYEAIRVGATAEDEVEQLLKIIHRLGKKALKGEEQIVHFFDQIELSLFELTQALISFDSEIEDLIDLQAHLVTDYKTSENFWPLINEIKEQVNEQVSHLIIEPIVRRLRHVIHLILLDLETQKNRLELDLIK
ncbi:hypothetical protein [Atopobacter phocae]|uniref:hypothetical protein n=1 Tax=Atopobacter phocae TaxID=136492 RepID=UPI00046EB628|nr:hypothetical protein [Atopobacter phocae]